MKHIHEKRISHRDKKVSRLRTLSQISRNEMAFLINAINNIYSTMHRENSNPKILKQLGQSALTTSKLIKNAVDVDKCIIDEFENDVNDRFDDFEMKDFKRIVALKRRKNVIGSNTKQNENTNKDKNCVGDNNNINNSDNSFDNDEDYKQYITQKQKFDKMLKLQELQGEILLNEQKKKYSLRDKFENKIIYPTSHFLRSPISTNKYKYVISSLSSNYLYSNTPHNKTKSLSYFNNSNNNNNNNSTPMSSTNLQYKRTLSSKCIHNKNHKVRIIIPSSTNHSRPLSSVNTLHYNNKSTRNQLLSYINNIEKEALSENESLKHPYNNNSNSHIHSICHNNNNNSNTYHTKLNSPLLNAHTPLKHKSKSKHKLKPSSLFEGINENELVKSNAANVNKYLDANGRKLLHNVIGQVIYEHGKAMLPHDKCSIYNRKTLSHKLNKTFKQVCKQTLSIQHDYFIDGVIGDTPSQDKYISNICKSILTKAKHSESSQRFSLMKSKLFHPRSSVYGDNTVVDIKRKKIKKSTSCINLNSNNNNKQY